MSSFTVDSIQSLLSPTKQQPQPTGHQSQMDWVGPTYNPTNFVAQYLAAPAQQTAQIGAAKPTTPVVQKPAPTAAQRVARAKRAGVAGTKRSKTFAVARSEKGKIPDENKMNENRLRAIMQPQDGKDLYNRYLRKLVANAKKTARNSTSLKFVPILSPRTGELMIITATGQHLAFKMNDPKHLMEVAAMAAHAGMSTEQLSAWASNYSRGLNELDEVRGLIMETPDATFNPNAKQDFGKLIRFNTPSPDKLYLPQVPSVSGEPKPQKGMSIPQVPSVSQ